MPEGMDTSPVSQSAQLAVASHPAAGMGDQRTEDAPQGENSELETKIENGLKQLVRAYDLECEVVRRHHVRRWLKAEEFWKGNHHLIWNERQYRFQTPFEWATENNKDTADMPRFQYVTNIYQSLGLSIIAAISQRLPKVRFQPKSTQNEIDIATAKAASDVVDLVERNNQLDMLSVRCAYLLWTQGVFGAWVRFVLDKDFGTQQVPKVEMGPTEVAPDRYFCPQCATEIPAAEVAQPSGFGIQQAPTCPQCGYQLDPEADFRPQEMGVGPVVTGTEEYPEGQEVISVYGGLNMKLLPSAEKLKDSPFLFLVEEKHFADVRAAYPLKASKIGSSSGATSPTADNNYERNGRMSLIDSNSGAQSARMMGSQISLMNAWLRPRAFWHLDDDQIRQELLTRYPEGVRVVLAGDEFMEAIPEDVDEHWDVCRPMPGVGMYVPAVGDSTIPLNERHNDCSNITQEHVEFASAPPVLIDGRYISQEALRNKRMRPGTYMSVGVQSTPGGVKLADMTKQIEVKLDSNIYSYGTGLIELAQMVSGALPSIFGGPLQGNDTASGYAMARVQSLGKLNLFWRGVMQFWARLQLLSVECFRKNRTQDYEHVITGKGGDFSAKFIRLENLKGNVTAHPEADQDFPASWAEIRENVLQMLKVAPDETKALLMHASNAPLLKKVMANPELIIPGESDQEKQFREIEELLQGEPVPETTPNPLNPLAPGIPTGDYLPTVEAEPFIDDHNAHIQTIQEWAKGDDGIQAKKMNGAGYANVMAHQMSHLKAQAYEQAKIAQIQMQTAAEFGIPLPQPGDDAHESGPNAPHGTDKKPPQSAGKDQPPSGATPGVTAPIAAIAQQPI